MRIHAGQLLFVVFAGSLLAGSVYLQSLTLRGWLAPAPLGWGIATALGASRLFFVLRQRLLHASRTPGRLRRLPLATLRIMLFLLGWLLSARALSGFMETTSIHSEARQLGSLLRGVIGTVLPPSFLAILLLLSLAFLLEGALCLVLGSLGDLLAPVWLARYRTALDARMQALMLHHDAEREAARFTKRVENIRQRARKTTEAAEAVFRDHRHKLVMSDRAGTRR